MSEASIIHISVAHGPFLIRAKEGEWVFEEDPHLRCPYTLRKDGELRECQPGQRSPFWKYHTAWAKAGKPTRPSEDGELGVCIIGLEEKP